MTISTPTIDELVKELPISAQLEVRNFVSSLRTKYLTLGKQRHSDETPYLNEYDQQNISMEQQNGDLFEDELPDIENMEYIFVPESPKTNVYHFRGKLVGIQKASQELSLSDEQWSYFT